MLKRLPVVLGVLDESVDRHECELQSVIMTEDTIWPWAGAKTARTAKAAFTSMLKSGVKMRCERKITGCGGNMEEEIFVEDGNMLWIRVRRWKYLT